MNRISDYVFREATRRRRDDRISLLIAFGFSLLMLFLGQPKLSVMIEGLGVLAVSMFLFTFYFCSNAPKIVADLRARPRRDHAIVYRPVTRRMAAISATLLAVLLPAPEVAAEVINRRLLRLSRNPNLTDNSALEMSSALKIAWAVPVKVPDLTRIQVYRAAKTSGLRNPESAAIVKCADDLIRYTREVSFTPSLAQGTAIAGSGESWNAYRLGAKYAIPVILSATAIPTQRPQDAAEAIKWFSRAIELGAGNADVLIGSLTLRAIMYLLVLRATDALNDAEKLESIGADLPNVLDIEGNALLLRAGHEDLERAVRVFTLAISLQPPTVSVFVARAGTDAARSALHVIEAFGSRGKAYYKLGQFEQSIQDIRHMLDLLTEGGLAMPQYVDLAYEAIIAANLRLDRFDQAEAAAAEWVRKSKGDPIARRVLAGLESSQFDRIEWLKEYEFTLPVR